MSPNRRIFLNIVATYGRSLYALVIGLFCGRWTLMALGEVDYGLYGVVGGMTAFVSFDGWQRRAFLRRQRGRGASAADLVLHVRRFGTLVRQVEAHQPFAGGGGK